MKKYLFFVFSIFISISSIAQVKFTETFDGSGHLDWNEYASKEVSALIKMGMLDLEVLKEGWVAKTQTDLPVLPEYDFKVTMKLVVPKIEKDEEFVILFDMDENFKRTAFVFSENKFVACTFTTKSAKNGMPSQCIFGDGEEIQIKLPKAKNREIEVVIERKGNKTIVSYNNIEVYKHNYKLHSPYLGFLTSTHLKVDELIVEQRYTGESSY